MTAVKENILAELERRKRGEGDLPLLLEFYRRLVETQAAAERYIAPPQPHLSSEQVRERLNQGKPLLAFEELRIEWTGAQALFKDITAVFSAYPQLFGPVTDKQKNSPLPSGAVKDWFNGPDRGSPLLRSIIHATVHPYLAAHAASLKALLTPSFMQEWRRAYCPVCGGRPDIAYLEKEIGARWLVCSRCDTEWLFQRLQCHCCGSQEQAALSYFTDEKELYRVYVCEQCRSYLKTVDLRKAEKEVLLPLERLYSMDLDKQAAAKGYHPCK